MRTLGDHIFRFGFLPFCGFMAARELVRQIRNWLSEMDERVDEWTNQLR